MSAFRLPLLYAFAGGCLSNAVLFGLWRLAGPSDSATQQHRSHDVVELVTPARPAPSVAHPPQLVAANAADDRQEAASKAAPTSAVSDLDNGGPAPAGSAVSDVLAQLETAYRERVAARAPAAPAQASATQERATAAAPSDNAVAAAEAPPSAPPQPVAEVTPVTPAVAVLPAAPVAVAPQVAPAALAPQLAAVPAFAGPDAAPPTEIHYGDVNQNTYITNVRQGDVYQIQIQMQQLAMLQYMQFLGASGGMAAPARRVGGGAHQRGALASGITNPDNPWGFHFAPPNLVR